MKASNHREKGWKQVVRVQGRMRREVEAETLSSDLKREVFSRGAPKQSMSGDNVEERQNRARV